ncbi:condensin complex subunit 2 [Lactuca sativa]|uniref:Condensin complex subunit 2 n=1 Tax=Lactuca sativa TaxID=4236 RepID=A0A9R1WNR1_LACSA|nr:condensin complex subunit 2 [Lactuca sativa]XP_023757127.1 condensin complex subunit 2 [Lactuca sativa]XP_023757128.1 condensin complex subunit 2 [Lactuca sativa]KAJ0185995.1 hypothetical protein LSAT_V11C900498690 [Lactuca sativa]
MAGLVSPIATHVKKQRATILSPVTTFVLGSNNDQLERAQARAARAASIRRKPVTFNNAADDNPAGAFLGQEQIMELFQNCIKLASENKINQKNTWELNLIDHLRDIIKVEEDDAETNFQKASCTLEAGVKIYSTRVDSVHAEAYKFLGAINRVGQDMEQGNLEDGNTNTEQRKQSTKKEHEQKFSPLSTLESSFENLNLKKFDVAFTVDPLYHQTSAQFDEGGAKGLLLNNLGVYGGCRVLFDSLEVPANCMSCSPQTDKIETIDISYAKDCMEQMAINISKSKEISPTLKEIVNMFDDKRPPDTVFAQNSHEPDYDDYALDGDQNDNFGTWDFVNDNEGTYEREEEVEPHEENEQYESHDRDVDDKFIKIDDFLFPRRGLTTSQNAWAGPEHWKYNKSKGQEASTKENGSPLLFKKPRSKKQFEADIDFMKVLENDIVDPFIPPKNPNSLLLPAYREPCNTMLPEDCHYQPEHLVKLFLLPNVLCFGKKRGKRNSDEVHQQEANPSWGDDDCGIGDQFDDGNAYSDVDDSLVSQPRQVEKIDIQYDKKSKQVDVHVLKDTLWSTIQEMQKSAGDEDLSFKNILSSSPAATSNDDITPHLSFICILHLANEHGLTLNSFPDMDDVSIHLPSHPNIP